MYQNIQGPFSQKWAYKFINFQSRITFPLLLKSVLLSNVKNTISNVATVVLPLKKLCHTAAQLAAFCGMAWHVGVHAVIVFYCQPLLQLMLVRPPEGTFEKLSY